MLFGAILGGDLLATDIQHYGILGMKWGVRRTPEQLGHKTSKTKKQSSADRQEVEELMKKGVKNLSDKELQKVLQRLNAEKNYKQLTDPNTINNGKSWTKKTVGIATGLAATAIGTAMYKEGESYVKSFISGFKEVYEPGAISAISAWILRGGK